ncbi:MAG: tetratricopeptide repeat protein [Verrucomicrobia bacterium]|nr:MAG: tetratricopeptide repeat protein [Verrucomicrobiota bacterium]
MMRPFLGEQAVMRTLLGTMLGGVTVMLLAGCGGAPGEREFNAGVKEYERGNFVRAKSHFEKSIHQPDGATDAVAWNYLGCSAWRLHQLTDARDAFEASLRLEAGYTAAQYNLAALNAAGGNISQAIALLLQVGAREPARTEPLEMMGQIYLNRQTWLEARHVLLEALTRTPHAPRVLTRLALAELGTGDSRRAVALLNQALDDDAKYPPALFNLAIIYQQFYHDKIQAAVLLRRFLEAAPQDENAALARQLLADLGAPSAPPAVAPTSSVRSLLHVVTRRAAPTVTVARTETVAPRTVESIAQEAVAEAEHGRTPQAMILFLEAAGRAEREQNSATQEKVLTLAAQHCFDQARIHAALGRFQLDHGRTTAALKAFKQALVLDPKLVPAHLGLADAAARTGEYDAALVALKAAVQYDPQNADALWQLAQLYDRALGSTEHAATSYRQFARLFTGDPRVLKAQERLAALEPGTARRQLPATKTEKRVVAQETAPAAVAANPLAAVQAYNRAREFQQRQEWDSAIGYYRRAIANNPGMATAWFNLGVVNATKGDAAGARDAYEHAVKVQPDMIAARYNLALLLREAHERAAAVAQLREILRQQPDAAAAYYVLGYIHADDPLSTEQAKSAYRKFLELAPNDPNAANVRDWLTRH